MLFRLLVVECDKLRSVLPPDDNRELIRVTGGRLVLLIVKPEIFMKDSKNNP
jgi:hypothetical protein